MSNMPNVVLRGGPADGQMTYCSTLGDPVSYEDVGGGSITYVDSDRVEEHNGIMLRVFAPSKPL